jgi:hypothetical protein
MNKLKYIFILLISNLLVVGGFFQFNSLNEKIEDNIEQVCDSSNNTIKSNSEKKITITKKNDQKPLQKIIKKDVKCLTYINNIGNSFNLSEVKADEAMYRLLFKEDLDFAFTEPNEQNVVTNDKDFGNSAQEYDPRKNNYPRFLIEKPRPDKDGKFKEFEIKKYDLSKESIINSVNCPHPKFYKEDIEKWAKSPLFTKRSYWWRGRGESFDTQVMEQPYQHRGELYYNPCIKSHSILVNECLINPKLDMQREDRYYGKNAIDWYRVKVYCKNSNGIDWVFQKSYYVK